MRAQEIENKDRDNNRDLDYSNNSDSDDGISNEPLVHTVSTFDHWFFMAFFLLLSLFYFFLWLVLFGNLSLYLIIFTYFIY